MEATRPVTATLCTADMQVQYQALAQQLQRGLLPLYIITGQEPFLMDEATRKIKACWRQKNYCPDDPDALDWQYRESKGTAREWEQLTSDLCSLSLFTQQTLYQVRLDKKTLDKKAHACLQAFIEDKNCANLLILQAPLLKPKDLAHYQKHPAAVLLPLYALNDRDFQQWIFRALRKDFPTARLEMASLIAQYTQGNLFAADQVIKKLGLLLDNRQDVSLEQIQSQLHNQMEFQAFELSDACLGGDVQKAIKILRQLTARLSEIPLLLWILGNDIRQLLRLRFCTRTQSLSEACKALKIWSFKSKLYQQANRRLDEKTLQTLHEQCCFADNYLKSGQQVLLKITLEQIAVGMCCPEKAFSHV